MIIETFQRLMDANLAGLAGSLTLADIGALVGIISALLSAMINLVYTWRKDRREQRESDAAWARHQKEP
jgi:energy-converting hydrogenase Eha subunit A